MATFLSYGRTNHMKAELSTLNVEDWSKKTTLFVEKKFIEQYLQELQYL